MARVLAGLAISAAGLWWAFRSTDWPAVGIAMQGANPWLLALSATLLLAALPVRGHRWGLFLRPFKRVPVRMTSEATVIGYFGNNVLPLRMGEIVRAYFLGKSTGLGTSKVIGTIILERVLDMLTVVLLLLLAPLVAYIPPELSGSAKIAGAMGLLLAVLTWWASNTGNVNWVPEKLRVVAENVRSGFASIRRRETVVPMLTGTAIIWAFYLASFYAALAAMGLQLSPAETYSLFVATTVVVAIPSAPGFIGTYHAMVIFMLVNVMGNELGQAQAAAVMLHAIGFLPYTLIGATLYFKSHIRLRAVMSQSAQEQDTR